MCLLLSFFFFNDTATTEIYTLSLHDALPISPAEAEKERPAVADHGRYRPHGQRAGSAAIDPARERDGEIALHDVTEQRDDPGEPAGRAQDVGRPDAAAAVAADVGHAEQPRDEVSDRDGSDEVRGDGREDDHDQRSSSGTIAR